MRRIVHVAGLGFNEQGRIAYVIQNRGGQKLVLVHSKENLDDAIRVQEDLQKHGAFEVELICVDPWDYHDVLQKVIEVAIRHHKDDLRFNPSLGTRVMTSALFVAANFTGSPVHLVKEEKGIATDVIDIYPVQRQTLSAIKKHILETLKAHESTGIESIMKLARLVKRSNASVSHHVDELSMWGYVETKREDRKVLVKITGLGAAVLRMAELWKKREKTKRNRRKG
ncbi:MAG: hypothetical protein HXY34_00125 [Candidatus Thorarchaeota archaeon]|nr:hypothetical protein [Candidatus Thorarchaeota archaeon]